MTGRSRGSCLESAPRRFERGALITWGLESIWSRYISGRAGALTPPGRGNGRESSDA